MEISSKGGSNRKPLGFHFGDWPLVKGHIFVIGHTSTGMEISSKGGSNRKPLGFHFGDWPLVKGHIFVINNFWVLPRM
jgi:hypothetical protein